MSHASVVCSSCRISDVPVYSGLACGVCGAPMDVIYSAAEPDRGSRDRPEVPFPGIWSLWPKLPLHRRENIISLGEGGTPCIPLENLGKRLGLKFLYAKLEYMNPTGSFKDRGTSAMLSAIKELGFSEVVEDSSGNAGASLAAYAARGGMRATVFVPAHAPPSKVAQIRFYGAELNIIEGDREAVAVAAKQYTEESGTFYASHNWSPHFVDGMKSVAYEMNQQLSKAVDHLVFPVGNGSLLLGTHKGFQELKADGKLGKIPRLHCVQPTACMPIVAKWQGADWDFTNVRPTVAGGISVSNPPRGACVVQALKETGGKAVAVEDQEILFWQTVLAQEEGLFMEPTSAAAFAGLEVLVSEGVTRPNDVTLVPVTGFGLKDRFPGM